MQAQTIIYRAARAGFKADIFAEAAEGQRIRLRIQDLQRIDYDVADLFMSPMQTLQLARSMIEAAASAGDLKRAVLTALHQLHEVAAVKAGEVRQ